MKRLASIVIILIFIIAIYMIVDPGCKYEDKKIKPVAEPIIEVLAKYSRENGIPKSLQEIKKFPYKLIPCSEKPDLEECKILKNGYFFKYNGNIYAVRLYYIPNKETLLGYGLYIAYNKTDCAYQIYYENKIETNYLKPACSLDCHSLWKQ